MTALAAIRQAVRQGGYLDSAALAEIAADPELRLELVLVRCGGGRFMVPADQCAHFMAIIQREGSDYVRDVSLPADSYDRWHRFLAKDRSEEACRNI